MSARRFIPQAVPQAALLDHELPNSGVGYKVLEAVAHYSQLGTCRASNGTLAERAGCGERTVRRWLTLWQGKGRIADLSGGGRKARSRGRQLVVVGMPPVADPAKLAAARKRRKRCPTSSAEVATGGHRTLPGGASSRLTPDKAPTPSGACADGARASAGRAPSTEGERQQAEVAEWSKARQNRAEDERKRVVEGLADLAKRVAKAGRAHTQGAVAPRLEAARAAKGRLPEGRCTTPAVVSAESDHPQLYRPSSPEAQAYMSQCEDRGDPDQDIARLRRDGVRMRPSEARRVLAGGPVGGQQVGGVFGAIIARVANRHSSALQHHKTLERT